MHGLACLVLRLEPPSPPLHLTSLSLSLLGSRLACVALTMIASALGVAVLYLSPAPRGAFAFCCVFLFLFHVLFLAVD